MDQRAKIIRERDAMARYSMSRSKVRKVAEECGAAVRIGGSFRIDPEIMDSFIDNLRNSSGDTCADLLAGCNE